MKVSGKWSEGDKDKLMHAFAFAGDPTGARCCLNASLEYKGVNELF